MFAEVLARFARIDVVGANAGRELIDTPITEIERFAASEPLKETQKQWKNLEYTFTVPDACGGAARLQLEPTAPWEARAGMSGNMSFDDFELRLQPRPTP